jgi:hypothetical protein
MAEITTGNNIEITVEELIDKVKREHGDDVDLSKIKLTIEYNQFKCFGYDVYDSSDYRIEINSEVL